MSDLREAAEHWLLNGDSFSNGTAWSEMTINGVSDVCRAYLADHPEDDEVDLSDEWLDGLKALRRDGFEWVGCGPDNKYEFVITRNCDDSYSANLVDGCDDISLGEVQTNGDVRRLCRGLKIKLKESK